MCSQEYIIASLSTPARPQKRSLFLTSKFIDAKSSCLGKNTKKLHHDSPIIQFQFRYGFLYLVTYISPNLKKTNSYWSRLTAPFIEQLLFLSQDAVLKCTRTMIYAKQHDSPFSSFLLGCQRASVSIELTISSIQNAKSSEESSLHMETKTE